MRLKLFILFFIFSPSLFAQSDYTNFVKLKKLFIQEKYSDLLNSDIDFKKSSEFYPYHLFYKSVAQYKLNSKEEALDSFQNIVKIFSNCSES